MFIVALFIYPSLETILISKIKGLHENCCKYIQKNTTLLQEKIISYNFKYNQLDGTGGYLLSEVSRKLTGIHELTDMRDIKKNHTGIQNNRI